jgi:hypothetical protein
MPSSLEHAATGWSMAKLFPFGMALPKRKGFFF